MPIITPQGQKAQIVYHTVTFRGLLDSLARPGKLNQLAYPTFLGTAPCSDSHASVASATAIQLNLYALGALSTLLDHETGFVLAAHGQWLPQNTSAVQWLALRTGARSATPDNADFAFFCDGKSNGRLAELNRGSFLEPELSATAVYCVEQLLDQPNRLVQRQEEHEQAVAAIRLELSGPGIQEHRTIGVVGLATEEIALITESRRTYPLGIDVYLIDATGCCVGLPRTTKIRTIDPTDTIDAMEG